MCTAKATLVMQYDFIFQPTWSLEYLSIILYPANVVPLRYSLASPAWQVYLDSLYHILLDYMAAYSLSYAIIKCFISIIIKICWCDLILNWSIFNYFMGTKIQFFSFFFIYFFIGPIALEESTF